MIHVVRWYSTGRMTADGADSMPASASDLGPDETIWIDLDDPTPEEEARVFREFFPVHPLTEQDVTKPRREPEQGAHLPKAEEFPEYLFVVVNPLPPELTTVPVGPDKPLPRGPRLGHRSRPQLSAILAPHLLVTHHYRPLVAVSAARDYAARHTECGRRGPDYLFHIVLDGMVDEYAPVVERLGDRLDVLERKIFRRPTSQLLSELLVLKRRVTFLRKTLTLEREVLSRLMRGDFDLIDEREQAYYRNVYDHLVRYTELVEAGREMVSDLMQTHLAAVSNRLNGVMKVLTMISTIVLPMTLIAGVYGMNFDFMPELHSQYGYPFALGLMATTGIVSLGYFRWKGWL